MANKEPMTTPIFDELLREMAIRLERQAPPTPADPTTATSVESEAKAAPATGRRRKPE